MCYSCFLVRNCFIFCCAIDKAFKTSFKKRGFHNIFNGAGNDLLDLFVKGASACGISHGNVCLPFIILFLN
jgi:hypothetical protein